MTFAIVNAVGLPTARLTPLLGSEVAGGRLPSCRNTNEANLECDLDHIAFRGRHLISWTEPGLEPIDYGFVDLRPDRYSPMGVRLTLPGIDKSDGLYRDRLHAYAVFIERLLVEKGRPSAHLNVPSDFPINRYFRGSRWIAKQKIERAVSRQSFASYDDRVPASIGISLRLRESMFEAELEAYVAASNDFYGVSCLDALWFDSLSTIRRRHHTSELRCLCFSNEQVLIGFADCQLHSPTVGMARQGNTYVRPEWRGRGIGGLIKQALVREIFVGYSNVDIVITHNDVDDPAMRRFAKLLGYVDRTTYLRLACVNQ